MQIPKAGLLCDLLWSDPDDNAVGWCRNIKRNGSYTCGPVVVQKFVESNGLRMVIRSHQLQREGYKLHEGGKMLSIWRAQVYRNEFNNRPAFAWCMNGAVVLKVPVSIDCTVMCIHETVVLTHHHRHCQG